MSDGANLGVTADRALKTILGGADQPSEDERATPEQVRERVMSAPSPLEGPRIYEIGGDNSYALATDAIAKAFLLVEQDDPGVLTRKMVYSADNTEIEDLWGVECSAETVVWKAVTARWPDFDEWIGGASGFMVGFAYNTARYIVGSEPVSNPAIMEIGDGND